MKVINQNILINDLLQENYSELIVKYNLEKLVSSIFYRPEDSDSIVNILKAYRFNFAFQFFPPNSSIVLSNKQKDQILSLVSQSQTLNANELYPQLTQIEPTLIISQDFNFQASQQEAIQIQRALVNIKEIFVENLAYDYLNETLNLTIMTAGEIQALGTESDLFIKQINTDYGKLDNVADLYFYDLKPELLERITTFLKKVGRTKMFIGVANRNPHVDQLLEIFAKFNVAAKIALTLKNKNTPITEALALNEIKNYLTPLIDF